MASILTRQRALDPGPAWPLFPSAFFCEYLPLVFNRYYYVFQITMSLNKTTHSPLALREGFHVVLLRALAERLQGRDWVLKRRNQSTPLLRQYPIQRRYRSRCGGKDVAGAMQRAIPATLADGDVQRRLQALGILQASLIGGRSSKSTDTTLRYKIELVGRGGIRPPTKIDVSYRDRCEGDEHAVSPANDSAVRAYLRPDDPPLLLPSYPRPAAIRQKDQCPLPRARTCRPVMYSICLFLEMERSEVSTLVS